jgi:hypothetical protein
VYDVHIAQSDPGKWMPPVMAVCVRAMDLFQLTVGKASRTSK